MTSLNNGAHSARESRRFEDSDGVVWSVRQEEMDDVILSFQTSRLAQRERRSWLYFRSPIATRRTAEFPAGWQGLAAGELEQLMRKSARAPL